MSYGTNAASGLQPCGYLNGANWTNQTGEYLIASGYATSLFNGDPVTLLADGTIGIGVAGAAIIGVFTGCKYTDSNGSPRFAPYWLASTATQGTLPATALVCDDPNVLYNIQSNSTTGVAVADLNSNANFVAGTGSAITGQSGFMLAVSTINTTATLNLKIIRFTPIPGNIPSTGGTTGQYNNTLCLINNHIYKGGTGTLGV